MSREHPTPRRAHARAALAVLGAALVVLGAAPAPSHAASDEWLVYIGGGLEPIEGGWEERRGRVIFTKPGGTLVSVPFADVDLVASTFITWQLGGRRQVPPRGALPNPPPDAEAAPTPPCTSARVLGLRSGETLDVTTGEEREVVHLACLDAPETVHRFPALGWFGRATLSAVQMQVRTGDQVCLTEQAPLQRDRQGHRIVYVTLADGRDYTAEVIGGGLGLLRPGRCGRAAHYRNLEDRAIAGQRGLWGQWSESAAFAAASHAPAVGAGPGPSGGGG
jgi:endonuclease YncB( thermonuclease family)